MERYIVVDGDYENKTHTKFYYETGEIIRYNSTSQIKCIGQEIIDDEVNYLFVEGQRRFVF